MGASGSVRDRARSVVVERLRRRSDFRATARGERASGRAFVLQARSRGDQGAVRVGFTVSRQVGNAVERNRVRRRLREMVRVSPAVAGGAMCPGHDYVLIGRRAALMAPFGEMMQEFDAALTRILAGTSRHGGTGDARTDPLHEAGSPPRESSAKGRRKSFQPSPKPPGPKPQER
ncbi:MAG: ribonuclease P protein component [Xanthobacteraceae bacterium]|nr:ribonuclease P protein component [Xanthobacteraceae bacterium]